METVRKGKIEAFVCTECGRDVPADPEVFEEDITKEEIQQIEEMYCPDCCGWFMVPVEGQETINTSNTTDIPLPSQEIVIC